MIEQEVMYYNQQVIPKEDEIINRSIRWFLAIPSWQLSTASTD